MGCAETTYLFLLKTLFSFNNRRRLYSNKYLITFDFMPLPRDDYTTAELQQIRYCWEKKGGL